MRPIVLAFAFLLSACATGPKPDPFGGETTPPGYYQFCHDFPASTLCKAE